MVATTRDRISKSQTEPCLRAKQRDYTIPVRLNQLPPLNNNSSSISNNNNSYLSSGQRDSRYLHRQSDMKNPISIMTRTFKRRPTTLMVIAIVTLTIRTEVCHTQASHQSPPLSLQRPTTTTTTTTSTTTTRPPLTSNSRKGNNKNSASYKEHLLSHLSESIERQHFNMKPVKSFAFQRPSKFDSGEDLSYDTSETNYHATERKKNNGGSSTTKVDEGLRQIMRMHEMAHQPTSKPNKALPEASASATSGTDSNRVASKLRELSRGPARVAASLINPNKVVTQVLSYISPFISSKLINQPTGAEGNHKAPLNSTIISRFALNPFVGRSSNGINNQAPSLIKTLFNAEPAGKDPINLDLDFTPHTSYLSKPRYDKTTADQRLHYTPQSSSLLNSLGDTVLKSALIKPNISPKDLMADASSESVQLMTAGGALPHTDSFDSPVKTIEGVGATGTGESSKSSNKPNTASSWLKDNANKLAQSYLQDSFRGLLTLSQLPILQTTPISTAPSVFERQTIKKKETNKLSTQTQQNRRQRAIDELYRYAYILGTGVRGKRDPLKALASVPSSSQKGVFSQRARNQLALPNNAQLLSYLRGLRSMISPGAAKPRGVMWDMATDPSLAVTVFHMLERASVALPLGFLLMPFVKMIHNPINGIDLGRILPTRASHRSVDYEELAKRLDVLDKMLG